VRCCDYDPNLPGWSCGQPCSTPLGCNAAEVALSDGKVKHHTCQVPCHQEPCPPCQVKEIVSCYCGKHEKEIACSDKSLPKESHTKTDQEVKSWLGFYQCPDVCGKSFDCGFHACEKRCHSQEIEVTKCPRSPDNVNFCPCGKTSISDLAERTTCQDPIPTCTKVCERTLHCSHACQSTCHLGECPPCQLLISARCRCGHAKFNLPCYEADKKELRCERTCTAMKSCGRHHCRAQCCSGDHLCTRICGRPLKCGNHDCTVLCHRGPCPPCLEASFEPLFCTCGKTEIPPPVRCGTQFPKCPHPCIIEPPCGHPTVVHTCHPPEEPCPKCPFLVEKTCMCTKKVVKNQLCFRAQAGVVSCGLACGALMPCGFHRCKASCHRHTNQGIKCTENCGKPRKSCGHACPLQCHAPSACDESKPCQTPVTVRCDCGLRKQEIPCQASSAEPSKGLKNLPCTEICARTERNRKLAEALDVDTTAAFYEPENMKGGYQVKTLEFFNANKAWSLEIEKTFRGFLSGNSMRYAFKPMPGQKREFVHELAEAYALDAESVDREPYRRHGPRSRFTNDSVEIYRSNRATLPRHTLSDASKLKNTHGMSASSYASSGLVQMRKFTPGVAYNAIYLDGVKGTVLQADLQMALNPILRPSRLVFSLKVTQHLIPTHFQWINNGKDVLLQPGATSLPIEDVEATLHSIIKSVRHYIQTSGAAATAELCWVNREGTVSYRESTRTQPSKKSVEPSAAAWNKFLLPKVETSNSYGALGGSSGQHRVVGSSSNGI
jgi:transcriptional repressor NF-X1